MRFSIICCISVQHLRAKTDVSKKVYFFTYEHLGLSCVEIWSKSNHWCRRRTRDFPLYTFTSMYYQTAIFETKLIRVEKYNFTSQLHIICKQIALIVWEELRTQF